MYSFDCAYPVNVATCIDRCVDGFVLFMFVFARLGASYFHVLHGFSRCTARGCVVIREYTFGCRTGWFDLVVSISVFTAGGMLWIRGTGAGIQHSGTVCTIQLFSCTLAV